MRRIDFSGWLPAAALAWALAAAPPVCAQEEPAAPAEAPAPDPAGLHAGPASCARDACHGATRPRRALGVAQNEFYVWLNRGPHAGAYEALFDERSRRMAAALGLPRPAWESEACVACHATAPAPGPSPERAPEAVPPAPGLELADGVSCESCHGPASGWRGGHTAADWSYRDSVEAGMTDLRDPAVRARVCLGCHLGEPGRLVDHDLIAAGHPELRFELDNYGRTMPPHWLPWSERPEATRPERPPHGARAWAVGQAAALSRAADEIARRARREEGGRWPDLSWLSCESCHRPVERVGRDDFAGPAGAVATAAGGPPGRRARIGLPPWSPARWAVLRVLLERHDPDTLAAVEPEVDRLAVALSRLSTPPAEVAAAAEAVARALDGATGRLDAVRWNRRTVRRTLADLAAEHERLAGTDLRSAEQVVQAVYSLAGALLDERPELAEGGLVDAVSDLERQLREDGGAGGGISGGAAGWNREAFRRALERIGEEVGR